MDSKQRIDKTYIGKSRKVVCDRLAVAFIQRNAVKIAHQMINLGIAEPIQYEYLVGFSEGFATALELVLSGSRQLLYLGRLHIEKVKKGSGTMHKDGCKKKSKTWKEQDGFNSSV